MINVNLSARHFQQPNLLEHCQKVITEIRIPFSSLSLEITESAVMPDPEAAIRLMSSLQSLGIRIALDDFGTGYSSLSYLHRFPLDSLKIDRSFVARVTEDDEIVRAIIALGRNLGLSIIAEGIETKEQLDKLRALGREFGQGYFFSTPIDAGEAADIIAARRHW